MIFSPESAADSSESVIPDIEIHVGMPQPWTHVFDVTMSLSGAPREELDLIMPVWTPGSYLVREFARNVQEFSATGDGRDLRWRKISKNVWRIFAEQASAVVVKYRVYAFETSVRNCFLDDSHGFISGAGLFMYLDGFSGCGYNVTIDPFKGWERISTGLDPVDVGAGKFHAPDFDTLVDCPIEIGNQLVLQFSVSSSPHYISIYGEGNLDPTTLCADIQKIVETAIGVVGEIPYKHYTFLVQLQAEGGGGLEHSNSCSLQVGRWSFRPRENYLKFLGLLAHEYFHLWNVKRIRPHELGPFDYTGENFTRLLWVSEGFTDYYDDLIVRRAGLNEPREYLENLAGLIQGYLETPGRLLQSAAEASFDAWIKFYRQDENSSNVSISYYTKGSLIALFLDLEIRHRTGERSLDELMRLLYRRYYKERKRGFTEEEFRAACQEVAGGPLEEIFDSYAYGTKEMDFGRYLLHAGLKLETPEKGNQPKGYLGATVKGIEGRVIVAGIPTGTPACNQGLNVNDEIIAVNGFRVSQESFPARIEETEAGTKMDILVSRSGKLRTLPIVIGAKPRQDYRLSQISDPTPLQKQIFEAWLGAAWDSVH